MKKTKLTRSLLAACSIVALSAVMYGCTSDGSENDLIATQDALDQEREAHAATQADLDTARGEVTTLSTALGAEMDPDPDSARGMLAAANARIGSADDPDSLMGKLAAATARIGTADNAASLLGMLAAEQTEVTRLSGLLGDETTPDPASVRGKLAAANTRIDTLVGELADKVDEIGTAGDPTSLLGMLAAERQTVREQEARIVALERGTDPGQLEPIRMAAKTASDDAATAETDADTAAAVAEAAMANRATIQTGMADSTSDATDARTAADTAIDEAAKALAAYEAAMTADNATDAAAERDKAIAAEGLAAVAQKAAEDARDEAVKDAAAELKIVAKTYSVGDTSIDETAGSSTVTVGAGANAQTTITGLLAKADQPMTTGPATPGVTGVKGVPKTDPDPYKAPVAGAAERKFPIGKLVDSGDDTARLMIVSKYAGTKTVNVYASHVGEGKVTGTLGSDGKITSLDKKTVYTLKLKGMYYPVPGESGLDPLPNAKDKAQGSTVSASAKPQKVYSYTDSGKTHYAVFKSTQIVGQDTNVTYSNVQIHVLLDRDNDDLVENVEVTAKIPEATAYKHINFGVWAGLSDAKKTGMQVPADLGIGFVQGIGEGMTDADMPNNGSGTYSGNWVATVQAEDEDGNGAIQLDHGAASLTADFGKGNITATLTELATLKGDISGNTFSGDKASDIKHVKLDSTADFTGTFSGGFYGAKAAEAGGVFDFSSKDMEAGAFRGAFGGDKK